MPIANAFRLSLLSGAAVLALAPTAYAADAADTSASSVEEVVVLAQRQQYRGDIPLEDLPQSISVVSAEVLKNVNVTRLDAALDLVAGVEHQNNFGGLWDSFAVRGFVGDPNVPSGYLVNGFNGGRGFGGPRDASNIERIEVLKGPGSALFGRGEPGGTVNIITKKPKFTPEGSFTASAGSHNTYRAEGDYTGPINDSVAVRINGAYENADSFRDYLKSEKIVVSPSVVVKFSDSTSLNYELEVVRQDVPFDRGVVAVNNQLGVIPNSRFLGEPGDGQTRVEVLGHQLQFAQKLAGDWVAMVGFGYRDTSLKGFSSDAELTASRQLLFSTGQYLSRQRRYRDYGAEHTVLRGELDGSFKTGSLLHHVLVGVDGEKFDLDQIQNRFRPPTVASNPSPAAHNAVDIFNPVYGNQPVPGVFQDMIEKQKAWGVYVQDQIDLTDQLKLRLGVRYDDFQQRITNRLTGGRSGQDVTKWSPQVGIMYQPTETFSLYASYGKGFRPNSGSDVSGTPFSPELTKSYEVGAKVQLMDDRLTGTVALYKTKKDNIITADPVNTGFSLAIGKAQSKGVEAEIAAELPAGIQARISYAYTKAEITNDILDPDFGKTVPAGSPLLGIAKNSANFLIYRDFELSGDRTFTLGANVHYVGKRLGETGTNFYLPDYTLVKVFASYKATDHIRISADVNNLFDKTYYPASYSRLWVQPGAPRTFTVRVGYEF
jgi:iron complex outermembrane recepter protein